jgi:hypothetical protein
MLRDTHFSSLSDIVWQPLTASCRCLCLLSAVPAHCAWEVEQAPVVRPADVSAHSWREQRTTVSFAPILWPVVLATPPHAAGMHFVTVARHCRP